MSFYELPADFDDWKTGHFGDDDRQLSDLEDDFDPRYDEPLDFGEDE
jgi:hypothetical protein